LIAAAILFEEVRIVVAKFDAVKDQNCWIIPSFQIDQALIISRKNLSSNYFPAKLATAIRFTIPISLTLA